MRYVQNVHIALIKCHIIDKDAPVKSGRPVPRTFEFKPASSDRGTGRMLDSGYTAVEEDDYKALMEQSRTFIMFSKPEAKMLVVHDDLPVEAQTPYDMMVMLRRDLVAANARIAELESATETGKVSKAAQEKIKSLEEANQAGSQQLVQALAEIDELKDKLAAANKDAEKVDSVKADKPAKADKAEGKAEAPVAAKF